MIDSKLHWLRAACSKVCVCLVKSGRLLIYIHIFHHRTLRKVIKRSLIFNVCFLTLDPFEVRPNLINLLLHALA